MPFTAAMEELEIFRLMNLEAAVRAFGIMENSFLLHGWMDMAMQKKWQRSALLNG